MTTSVVAVITDVMRNGKPVCGFAFNSTGRYACGAQMRARFIPRILAADPPLLLDAQGNLDPEKILAVMMQAREGRRPFRALDRHRHHRGRGVGRARQDRWTSRCTPCSPSATAAASMPARVFCYVGGGWYWPGQTIKDLQDEMRRHLDAGYTMVKMKVGGLPLAEDLRRLEAVLAVVGSGDRLAVDANCRFEREEALRYAEALAPFDLRWFEEPVRPARLRAALRSGRRLCRRRSPSGENLFSTQDVENLVRFGGLRSDRDVIQIDPPQAYGIVQFSRTVAMLKRHGWLRSALFPHGGNQMSLAIAAGFGLGGAESYPGVFGDFGGFADDARVENGTITLSDRPGIGFEGQAGLYKIMRALAGI